MPLLVRTWNLFHGNAVPPRAACLPRGDGRACDRRRARTCSACRRSRLWALRSSAPGAACSRSAQSRAAAARERRARKADHRSAPRPAAVGASPARRTRSSSRRSCASRDSDVDRESSAARASAASCQRLRLDGGVFVANLHVRRAADEQFLRVARRSSKSSQSRTRAILVRRHERAPGRGRPTASCASGASRSRAPAASTRSSSAACRRRRRSSWPEERRRSDGRLLSDHAPVELTVG